MSLPNWNVSAASSARSPLASRASRYPACVGEGGPRRHRGNPTNFCAIEFLGQEMTNDEYANALIDGGDAPAIADIKT